MPLKLIDGNENEKELKYLPLAKQKLILKGP